MRVVITGGAGFVGSQIAEAWQEQADVIVLDNLRSGFRENLAGLKVEFIEGDITDRAAVNRCCEGADLIYHEAALVSVAESILDPALTEQINVSGLLNVLGAAKQYQVPRVVFASSAAVYGDLPNARQDEALLPHPLSPYAATKVAGEHYMAIYSLLHQVSGVSLRNFNIFGPRQDPFSPYASVVPIFIRRALRNEDLVIYGDGLQTRDFIYVKDVVAANQWFGQNRLEGVYNVAGGNSISINQLAELIIKLTGSSSRITHGAPRPGEVRHSLAAIAKVTSAGFTTAWELEAALGETIAYYKEQN